MPMIPETAIVMVLFMIKMVILPSQEELMMWLILRDIV